MLMELPLLFIGTPEIIVILAVVLLLFGSKRIPEIARGLGKGMRQFKDATSEIQRDIEQSARDIKEEVDVTKQIKD